MLRNIAGCWTAKLNRAVSREGRRIAGSNSADSYPVFYLRAAILHAPPFLRPAPVPALENYPNPRTSRRKAWTSSLLHMRCDCPWQCALFADADGLSPTRPNDGRREMEDRCSNSLATICKARPTHSLPRCFRKSARAKPTGRTLHRRDHWFR